MKGMLNPRIPKLPTKKTRKPLAPLQEAVLELPAPHSEPQSRLINAWKLRFDPKTDPNKTKPFFDPSYPHWESLPIAYPGLQYVCGACGTKFGKTFGCAIWIIEQAWNKIDPRTIQSDNPQELAGPGLYWWVAPSYAQAENAYEQIKRMLPDESTGLIKCTGRPDYKIEIRNPDGSTRSVIRFKSADDEDKLRGFGVHGFVLDEAARGFREGAFISVQTTTTETQGIGIIISTPNGRGWFYAYYQRGVKHYADGTPKFSKDSPDPYPEWFSVRMPTHMNPLIDLKVIEMKRRTLSEDMFRQEYLAEFIAESAGVFRKISKCERGSIEPPIAGQFYVVGVDLAKLKDYTVITVMNRRTRHVVHMERHNRISWEWQKQRIIEVAIQYNRAVVVVDSTGVGDPIFEDLQHSGLNVIGYKIHGNEAKKLLIERTRVAMENERISFPAGSRECPAIFQLREELEHYEYKFTPSGIMTFSAPRGQHDDCVISLCLAVLVADQQVQTYRYRQLRGV